MNGAWMLSSGAMVLLLAWIGHGLPLARPPLLFGLPVPEGFAASDAGQALVRRFRRFNAAAAVLGMVLSVWQPAWAALATLLMVAAFYEGRSRVRPHVVAGTGQVRRAMLAPPVSNWIWVAMLPPVLVLAGCALALFFAWDRIPERFPVHWGTDGLPNGWATRTPRKVFGLTMIGGATWLLMCGMLAGLLYGTRRTPGQNAILRASVWALVLATWAATGLTGVLSLQPLMPDPRQPVIPIWVALLVPVVLVGAALIPLRRAMSAPGDPEDAAAFARGEFYANPDDPAWMVPKASGLGYTVNFGHPVGRYLFPLVLVVFLVVVFYVAR